MLKERRSTHEFREGAAVDLALVKEVPQTVVQTPSWKDSQTTGYYAIMSKEMSGEVKASCLPGFNQKDCKDAPMLTVTAFVKNHSGRNNQGNSINEVSNGWGCYDLGPRDNHLILKAKDLRLDTLITGIYDADILRELLGIDQGQEVVSVIAVGYRDIDPVGPGRKGLNETTRFY